MKKTISFVLVVVLTLVGSVATGGIVFLDDFEDGSAADGAPVTWSPLVGGRGSFDVIDGDYVMTRPSDIEEMYSMVNQYTLADTSIRTQARLIGISAWWLSLGARSTPAGTYVILMKNNARLEIWRFGPSASSSWMLAGANVGIDPREQDILLRFDVIGNELSAWAWLVGDPMPTEPQVRTVHSEFATGVVGVAADLGSRLSNNDAIFRYVEVYEPITLPPDFNGDGIVDIKDIVILTEHWGENYPLCDVSPMPWGDGIVDIQDLLVLTEYIEPIDRTLIAHWALDETEGIIAEDSVGDNYGTLNGEPLWQPSDGKVGGALQFDGSDDYIDCDFVLDPGEGAFSVFAWIKGGAPGQVIISQTDSFDGSGETWLGTEPSIGKLMTGLAPLLVGRSAPKKLESEFAITDGQWHHTGFVWDGSIRALYVDGIEVAKDTEPQTSLESSYGGLYVGAGRYFEVGTFFSGLIDDVRIYNQALSAEEIEALTQ